MKILVINEGSRGVDAIISIIKMMSVDFSLYNTGEEGVEVAAIGEHKLVIISRHHDDIIGNKISTRINKRNKNLKMIVISMDSVSTKEEINIKHDNIISMNTPYEISDLSDLICMSLTEEKCNTYLKYANQRQ